MPITQDRMLNLIEAAQDYKQAWTNAVQVFAKEQSNIDAGLATEAQAWYNLGLLLRSTVALTNPIKTTETMAREIEHFRISYRKNINSANWQRANRGAKVKQSDYGIDSTAQTSRYVAKPASPRIEPPPTYTPIDPRLAYLGQTDNKQVQPDSELFPAEPDDAGKAAAMGFLENLERQEEYKQQYGDDSSPVKPGKEG